MNSESSLFPSAFVGGRVKPCLFSDDPFSSPISSWERTLGTDDEEAPMAPLKQRRSYLLDDGPCSRRAPDGRVDEVAIYEAYLEAGVRSGVPSLVAEVSSYFGFCPSQLTPLSWRTLMPIQVLGNCAVSILACMRSCTPIVLLLGKQARFYFLPVMVLLWSGSPREVPEEIILSEITGTTDTCIPPRVLCWEAVVKLVMEIPLQFRWVSFLVSKEALRHSRIWGSVAGLPLSAVFQNYQGVKVKRRRSSFNLTPSWIGLLLRCLVVPLFLKSMLRLELTIAFKDIHQKLLAEVFSLRGQVQDMMAHIDRLIQQVRVATRWKLMKEWLEERTGCWNPGEEYR
ncbi:hypothetical protein Bca101_009847 [Brassica carinata]